MVKRKLSKPIRRQIPTNTSIYNTRTFQKGKKLYKLHISTIKEITNIQSSTQLCMLNFPFFKLVRKILMDNTDVNMKIERKALDALQKAAEILIIQLFEHNRCVLCNRNHPITNRFTSFFSPKRCTRSKLFVKTKETNSACFSFNFCKHFMCV